MPAVLLASQLDATKRNILSPCPADERVCEWYDVPNAFAPGVRGGSEGEQRGEDGITRQKCGGGHRVIRKRISGS